MIELAPYTDGQDGGVRLLKDVDSPLEGRHVLLVEDVVDTGLTLHFLCRTLGLRSPASLAAVTLLDRPYRRLVDELPLRFVGFTVPDELFAGYGLGLDERWRAFPTCTSSARSRSRAATEAATATAASATVTRASLVAADARSRGLEIEQRVDGDAVDAHLEVQVRPGRVPGRARRARPSRPATPTGRRRRGSTTRARRRSRARSPWSTTTRLP